MSDPRLPSQGLSTSKSTFISVGLFVLFTSLACVTIIGGQNPQVGTPISLPLPVPDETSTAEPAACPIITDRIIEENSIYGESIGDEITDFIGRDEKNETYIISYLVSGDEILDPTLEQIPSDLLDEQADTPLHFEIWNYFAALIPFEYRDNLEEFRIMSDGPDNILAAVSQTYDDPNHWMLEVDIVDAQDYYYLTFTLVHEFAHLLTLGPNQVPPSEAIFRDPEDNDLYLQEVSACPNFFPGEGCSKQDSYINEFYEQFWTGIFDEWNTLNLEEQDDLYYDHLDQFYTSHQDQFLTDYSVTHPAEDIAESFSFFIFSLHPTNNTIAEQKILFFYQFPELVNLRAQILENLCSIFPR